MTIPLSLHWGNIACYDLCISRNGVWFSVLKGKCVSSPLAPHWQHWNASACQRRRCSQSESWSCRQAPPSLLLRFQSLGCKSATINFQPLISDDFSIFQPFLKAYGKSVWEPAVVANETISKTVSRHDVALLEKQGAVKWEAELQGLRERVEETQSWSNDVKRWSSRTVMWGSRNHW